MKRVANDTLVSVQWVEETRSEGGWERHSGVVLTPVPSVPGHVPDHRTRLEIDGPWKTSATRKRPSSRTGPSVVSPGGSWVPPGRSRVCVHET